MPTVGDEYVGACSGPELSGTIVGCWGPVVFIGRGCVVDPDRGTTGAVVPIIVLPLSWLIEYPYSPRRTASAVS